MHGCELNEHKNFNRCDLKKTNNRRQYLSAESYEHHGPAYEHYGPEWNTLSSRVLRESAQSYAIEKVKETHHRPFAEPWCTVYATYYWPPHAGIVLNTADMDVYRVLPVSQMEKNISRLHEQCLANGGEGYVEVDTYFSAQGENREVLEGPGMEFRLGDEKEPISEHCICDKAKSWIKLFKNRIADHKRKITICNKNLNLNPSDKCNEVWIKAHEEEIFIIERRLKRIENFMAACDRSTNAKGDKDGKE